MNTFRRKTLALLLICCIVLSMSLIVSASGTDGRSAELPDPDLGGNSGTNLYTMKVSNLTGLKSGNKFYKSDLPSGHTKLKASGKLTHTGGNGLDSPTIRAGFGFVKAGGTSIVPQYYEDYYGSSVTVYKSVSKSALTSGGRYCGIIKNLSPDYGTVTGSMTVYTSK